MTTGYFSPLPPAPTGVADYSSSLLPALGKLCEVKLNSPAADICLYHLGNNHMHAAIYDEALRKPGIVVLHDAVMHHFFLRKLDRDAYIEEFVYNYGEFRRGQAVQLWEARPRSAQDPCYFEYAMIRRIAEASRAIAVHNSGAAAIVRRHAPEARVVEIPHLFAPPPAPSSRETAQWRERHGFARESFVFGLFGYLRESKRMPAVLSALAQARRTYPGIALLVAGSFVSPDLERSIASLEAPGVVRVPYLEESDFWTAASAVDACINLRYPSAGETSGIAIRLMGLGKPVILSAIPETAAFPEGIAIRIDHGPAEVPMLAEYMMWFAESPERARRMGASSTAYIATHHSVEKAARCYYELLSSCC